MALPREYQEFLAISDGLTVDGDRPFEIYGTKDLRSVELRNLPSLFWVITDLYEEGAVVMRSDSPQDVLVYLAQTFGPLNMVSTLKKYVYDSLKGVSWSSKP
jgi:hypothetical protein